MLETKFNFFILALVVLFGQALFMLFDEFYFHRRRGLKDWETWGHPLDTLFFFSCFFIAGFTVPDERFSQIWMGLAITSSLIITKDEWVHKKECSGSEQWLHALLFLIHPISLWICYKLWQMETAESRLILRSQSVLILGFLFYQLIYWKIFKSKAPAKHESKINNTIYSQMGDRWFYADDDPVALLRAQSRLLGPWIWRNAIAQHADPRQFLEIGCGGGLIARQLLNAARHGKQISYTGTDLASDALQVASQHCPEGQFQIADAEKLSFPDHSFDVVIAMDLLEHVENPDIVVAEASRILRPGGLFFFHTFNRNALAYILVIKMVEWFVPNTPKHMHVIDLFIKPEELQTWLDQSGCSVMDLVGVMPDIVNWSNLKGIFQKKVPDNFSFHFTRSTRISYAGIAKKIMKP